MNPQVSKGNLTWFQDVRTCVHCGLEKLQHRWCKGRQLLQLSWQEFGIKLFVPYKGIRSWLSDTLMEFLVGVALCTKLEGLQSLYCLAAPQSTELNFPGRKYEMPFVFVVAILCA